MNKAWLLFVLAILSCTDPTATSPRPAAPTIVGQEQSNSYSVSADGTVYVTLTRVRGEGGETIHAFMRRMFESANSVGARRLVLDLTSVSGSDTFLLVPLLKGVVAGGRFVGRGALVVVVGRESFSPAQNAATLLRQYANPVFVSAPR